MDGRRFPSALQTAGCRFTVLAENQRRGRRPYRETVPLSYDGAESPEPQSQGSNTAKAHLIFVQNIDFYACYPVRFIPGVTASLKAVSWSVTYPQEDPDKISAP